jgi:multicomponent Na+:H+ antiporter subunit E
MRIIYAIELLAFYLYEVVISNVHVAYDVLTPTHLMHPRLIDVDISALTDRQLLAAANLITMTPGTLSLDVNEARTHLQVHCMYADDSTASGIETNYLRRIRRVF